MTQFYIGCSIYLYYCSILLINSTPTCRSKVTDNPLYVAPDDLAEVASIASLKEKVTKEDKDDDNSSDRDY